MKNDITKLFHLTSVIVDKFKVDKEVLVYIRSPRTHCFCPKCEKTTRKIYDRKTRRVVHGVMNGRSIVLVVRLRRFRCKYCGNIFTEKINGVSQKRYSDYFQIISLSALKNSSFLAVSKEYHVSIPTLVSFMKENFKIAEYPQGDLRLNIDEHSFRGRDLKITIGEINNRKLLNILGDDNQRTLINYLKRLPEDVKTRISEVCIDMKYSYKVAILQELPEAKLVIDKFHVVKELVRQMEDIRKIFQQQNIRGYRRINRFLLSKNIENLKEKELKELDEVFVRYEKFPVLKQCYLLKERVRKMYKLTDYKSAEKELNLILLSIENYPVGKMREIHNTLSKWKPYILNYFYSRTTNAFIEGCHNKIKLIKRTSFGFRNFTNYMMKITLAFAPIMLEFIHTNT
jgi:transposase